MPGEAGGEGRAAVLVVDDSAITREVLREVLGQAGFEVHTAATAELALRRISERKMAAIVLDLVLPDRSGLELMHLLPEPRPPIVICSSLAARDASTALAALEAGAVDVIGKPEIGVHAYLEGSAERIVGAVREAIQRRPRDAATASPPPRRAAARRAETRVIALGASAGGVEALHKILPQLPANLPPIVVVQHMPAAFCEAFAQRLDQRCALSVSVARDGQRLARGQVLVAPGGLHLRVGRAAQQLLCRLDASELVKRHRPSVDVLFGSIASSVGDTCVAILLTGMGDDGVDGLLELKRAGATTIAQDESSSAVYGMPREAARRGAAHEILPLQRVAPRLVELCCP